MMNKKNYTILFLLISFSFFSCNTLKQSGIDYSPLDYTSENLEENEIKRIEQLLDNDCIKALWRAKVLGNEKIFVKTKDTVVKKIQKNLEEKDYFTALKDFYSLKTVDASYVKNVGIPEKDLIALNNKDIPGLKVDNSLLPSNLNDCIDATVTIWVDKGISIKNGIGYADRVLGSGFFIDSRGYIVTNHHVISDMVNPKYEGFSRLYIKIAKDNETRIPAKIIGYDAVLDLALLKCEIDPPFILQLGSSSSLTVGDKVSTIGTPLGLHGTVTSGIVSSVSRKLFSMGDVFQIDAAVNSGNSGGPLIDDNYRVQAIVFAGIMQYQGLNFAIPVEYLRQDLPFLYKGGKREHTWTGGYGHTKKDNYKEIGLDVQYVMPGSVLDRAGIRTGDLITFVDDERVCSIEDFHSVLRNFSKDSILKLSYIRDGQTEHTFIYLEARPDNPGYSVYKQDLISGAMVPLFGMELTPSSTLYSRKFTITRIINGSIADESGFSINDPVTILDVQFDEEKTVMGLQVSTKKRKKGYIDISIGMSSALDSAFYF